MRRHLQSSARRRAVHVMRFAHRFRRERQRRAAWPAMITANTSEHLPSRRWKPWRTGRCPANPTVSPIRYPVLAMVMPNVRWSLRGAVDHERRRGAHAQRAGNALHETGELAAWGRLPAPTNKQAARDAAGKQRRRYRGPAARTRPTANPAKNSTAKRADTGTMTMVMETSEAASPSSACQCAYKGIGALAAANTEIKATVATMAPRKAPGGRESVDDVCSIGTTRTTEQ